MTVCSVTIVMHVGQTRLRYSVERDGEWYNLHVSAGGKYVGSVIARDVVRDAEKAEALCSLFARNLVFPDSVFEVLDDLLGTVF